MCLIFHETPRPECLGVRKSVCQHTLSVCVLLSLLRLKPGSLAVLLEAIMENEFAMLVIREKIGSLLG